MLIIIGQAMATAVAALVAAGVPEASARLQADLLIDAESRGLPSHGLLRLPRLVARIRNGVADPVSTGIRKWRGDALLEVDGGNGLGPVVACAALDVVSARASKTGIACAAINASNHLGALGWYVRAIAERGQVCIALTTSEAIMHPHGGRTAMIGSNPIAIGVPSSPRPMVFDMATSVVAMGKVHDYANKDVPLEQGWARDADGEPTVDAAAAKEGAIAPFGGAKGYGLGLAFGALVASVTGSETGRRVTGTLDSTLPPTKGDLFIVIEVASAEVANGVSRYFDEVRSSPPVDAWAPVSVPGDGSACRLEGAVAHGLEIPEVVWQAITALAENTEPAGRPGKG